MRRLACCLAPLLIAATGSAVPSDRAPVVVPPTAWRSVAPGVERTTFEVSASGEGWRTLVVAIRVEPTRYHFRLRARLRGAGPGWTVDRAPADAVLALNAGQFSGYTPWGWLVMGGEEVRPPGQGPLSTAIAWDRDGSVRWLRPDQIAGQRARGGISEAFQSYPTLIDSRGELPRQIVQKGMGVRVGHRDGRLAIGGLADGRLLVAMTRFHGLGDVSPALPLGLTLSEMATVMRGLGCTRAVSLDGGISAQLMLRESGRTTVWRGWRRVPLGLVAQPRESEP